MDLADTEIPARIERARLIREIHAQRRGTHPEMSRPSHEEFAAAMESTEEICPMIATPPTSEAPPGRPASLRQRILDVCPSLPRITATAVLEALGEGEERRASVSASIVQLRKAGLIPEAVRGLSPGRTRKPRSERTIRQPSEEPMPSLRAPDPAVIRNTDPKADGELLVIQRVLAQLDRLATPRDRRRVLAYLADREEE